MRVLPLFSLALLPGLLAAAANRTEFRDERETMVAKQIAERGVKDAATLAAMERVPRHLFVPSNVRAFAYDDSPLPIGFGQTISQPYMVAYMTQTAGIRQDSKVLEIGTGSGYQAAVAAELSDQVYSIEIVPPLAERAASSLKEAGYPRIHLRAGDGYHGWPEAAPFDVIIVTAAASTIPPPLVAQLAEGGRMVIPVGPQFGAQNLVLVTKKKGKTRTRTLMPVRFVPFTREEK